MNINFKYLALASSMIAVTGGSSGSEGGPLDEPTNTSNPTIGSVNSTIVGASDVFDPNNLRNQSTCSAPYYETLSGIYQGTLAVRNEDGLNCSWSVELRVIRLYKTNPPDTRNFCAFDVKFLATPTISTTLGESFFDAGAGEDGDGEFVRSMIPCQAADPSGEIFNIPSTVDGRDLTHPNFPLDAEFKFYNDVISTNQQTSRIIGVYPDGMGSGLRSALGNSAFALELIFDGSGAVTIEKAMKPDPFWFTNITKVQTDIEFLATEF